MLILAVAACCIACALEISTPKSETAPAEQEHNTYKALNSLLELLHQQVSDLQSQIQQSNATQEGRTQQLNDSLHQHLSDLQSQIHDTQDVINSSTQQLNNSFHQQVSDLQTQIQLNNATQEKLETAFEELNQNFTALYDQTYILEAITLTVTCNWGSRGKSKIIIIYTILRPSYTVVDFWGLFS